MKIEIVSAKEIEKKKNVEEIKTRFSKELAMATKLPKGKAVKLTYRRHELAGKARETISAFTIHHKLNLKVYIRGNNVYIAKAR